MRCSVVCSPPPQLLDLRRRQSWDHFCSSSSVSPCVPSPGTDYVDGKCSQSPSVMDAVHRASLRQVSLADELHRTKLKYRCLHCISMSAAAFLTISSSLPLLLSISEVLVTNATLQQQVYESRRSSSSSLTSSSSPPITVNISKSASCCGMDPVILPISLPVSQNTGSIVSEIDAPCTALATCCSTQLHHTSLHAVNSPRSSFVEESAPFASDSLTDRAWNVDGFVSGEEHSLEEDEIFSDEETSSPAMHPALRFTLKAPPSSIAVHHEHTVENESQIDLVPTHDSQRIKCSRRNTIISDETERIPIITHHRLGRDGCDGILDDSEQSARSPSEVWDGIQTNHQQQNERFHSPSKTSLKLQVDPLQMEILALKSKSSDADRAHEIEREEWKAARTAASAAAAKLAEASIAEFLAKKNPFEHDQHYLLLQLAQKEVDLQEKYREKAEALLQMEFLLTCHESESATAAAGAEACIQQLRQQLFHQQQLQHKNDQALSAALARAAAAEASAQIYSEQSTSDLAAANAAAAASATVVEQAQGKVQQVTITFHL
jgi:hypothetical protein